ncbi:MAG: formylglycine-generating enzyme family protein [Planctomycetota bacterium]|nr:formylglycine-generating enzyme family protein [Planctomycetota bacterium]
MFQSICKGVIAVSLWLGVGASSSSAQPPKEITNSIGMKLVLIPKGQFMTGSPRYEEGGSEYETHQHEVEISQEYYLGVYEVTQAQYMRVMGTNPSWFTEDTEAVLRNGLGADPRWFKKSSGQRSVSAVHPVERVSWEDAVEFCKKLSELPEEKKTGRTYRLPTEAEWAHACLAGSKSAWSYFDKDSDLLDYAWFGGNSKGHSHPVGEKKPNEWGLYDMYGNVWEWCSDLNGAYPEGAKGGWFRVARGGGWGGGRRKIRARLGPSDRGNDFGFRVALSPSTSPQGGDELKR